MPDSSPQENPPVDGTSLAQSLTSLLTNADAQARIKSALITNDKDAGYQLAKTIINAAQINHFHLTTQIEEETINRAVRKAEQAIAADKSEHSLKGYFRALRTFNDSPYRMLTADFGNHRLSDIYVALRAKNVLEIFGGGTVELTSVLAHQEATGKPVLIEGNPGGGKSTLLRHIALHAWDKPEVVGLRQKHIPMLVRLQCVAETEGTVGKRLWRAVERAKDLVLVDEPPSDFFGDWAQRMNSPWLLLFDGWDEIHERHRLEVANWLRTLLRTETGTPFHWILTTRPTHSFPDDLMRSSNHYLLESLDQTQQHELARRWLGDRAERFLSWINSIQAGSLRKTPLLLTIAAFVYNRGKENSLPVRRVDLYSRFLNIWLGEALQRGGEEQIEKRVVPHVETVLERIATAMTENEENNISTVDDLVPIVAQTLSPLFNESAQLLSADGVGGRPGPARALLDILGERSGVFLRIGETCTWLHPTFREYFTARALARPFAEGGISPYVDTAWQIVSRWSEDRWRQIILMLLAEWSSRHNIDELFDRLINSDPPRSAIFAGRAVTEGARIAETTDIRLVHQLCNVAREAAEENICARALTGPHNLLGGQVAEILHPRLREPHLTPILDGLKQYFVAFARRLQSTQNSLKIRQSAVFDDLKNMEFWDALLGLAKDESLRPIIRVCALEHLPGSYAQESVPLLVDLMNAQEEDGYDGLTPMIFNVLATLGGPQKLQEIASRSSELPSATRLALPNATEDQTLISNWANDYSLPYDLRIGAWCRLLSLISEKYQWEQYHGREQSEDQRNQKAIARERDEKAVVTELLRIFQQGDESDVTSVEVKEQVADLVISTLSKCERADDLQKFIRDHGSKSDRFRRVISKLAEGHNYQRLQAFVLDDSLPVDGREEAAIALVWWGGLSDPENLPVAEQLMTFLNDRLLEAKEKPSLLKARIKLHLSLDNTEGSLQDLNDLIGSLGKVISTLTQMILGTPATISLFFARLIEVHRADLAWALRVRGACYFQSDYNYSAIDDLTRALAIEDGNEFCFVYRAVAYHDINEYLKSIADFDAANTYEIGYSWAVWRHADSLRSIGRQADAISILDDYLSGTGEEVPEAWAVRGACELNSMSAETQARNLKYFDRAIELAPSYVWAYQQRSFCYRRLGQLSKALLDLNQICQVKDDNRYAVRARAQLCVRVGAVNQARTDIDRLRELGVWEAQSLVLEALSFLVEGNPSKCQELAEEAFREVSIQVSDPNVADDHLRGLMIQAALVTGNFGDAYKGIRSLVATQSGREYFEEELLLDLNDVVAVLKERSEIKLTPELNAALKNEAPPVTKPVVEKEFLRPKKQPHVPYACPMYCRKEYIAGLHTEKFRADRILKGQSVAERKMVLFTIDDEGHNLYGQCNFKQEAGDDFNLKFSDSSYTVLWTNLTMLVRGYRVQSILFTEQTLLDEVRKAASEQGLAVRCSLVNDPV